MLENVSLKLNQDIVLHSIEELNKYWLFNIKTGDIYDLNEISYHIIVLIQAGNSLEEILAELCNQYESSEAEIAKDLEEFINRMINGKMLEDRGNE